MRRFISYLLLGAATLIGVGAAVAPTVLRMDADMAYANGQTLFFKASEWDDSSLDGNYVGADGHFLDYDPSLSKQPIEYIADTMRTRLDAYGLSGYSVETQGADTVAVTVRTRGDNATIYSYLQKYLAFSGGDYELDASDVTKEDYAFNENWTTIIDGQTAFIADMEQGTYNVPTVIVPLKSGEDYKDAFKSLVDYCKNNTVAPDEEHQESGSSVNLIVWANRGEADNYADASSNPNVAAKIVSAVNPDNAVYYQPNDTEQETPYLRLIPNSSATSGESYDPSKTQAAYDAAVNLMLTINAGSFQYDELKASSTEAAPRYSVCFAYSEIAPASVENIASNGEWNQSLALSATLIASGVALILLVVLLAIFERVLAVLELSIVAISTFSTLAVYAAFGTPFSLPMVLGLVTVALISLFGGLYYSAKLKEEIYKGRTLKKAHAEAVKKALMPTVDVSIVAILLGVCVYGLAGDVASKFGVVLVLGGFFSLIASLLFTRVGGYLLCSDNTAAESFPKMLRVQPSRIPDLSKQEKQTYFGAYAEHKFSKGKVVSLTFSCLMLLAGIGSAIGWGIASKGNSFFNQASYENAAPVLRIDVRSNASDRITLSSLSEASDLLDDTYKEGAPKDVFHYYKINDAFLADYVSTLTVSDSPKSVYEEEGETGLTYYWFFYEAELGKKDSSAIASSIKDASKPLTISRWDGTTWTELTGFTLSDLAGDIIDEFVGGASEALSSGAFADEVYITFNTVVPADLTPYLWQVTLALGVAAATILVYFVIRFRPSRGLVAGLLAGSVSTIAVSFFILTRISTLPIVSVAGASVLMLVCLLAIAVLSGEKEIFRESKEKEKESVEFRASCLEASASRGAEYSFLFALIAAILFISFLAFGPSAYQPTFLGVILGIAFAIALVITALPFLSGKVAGVLPSFNFSAKRLKKRKVAKQGGQLLKKNKTGEPEESVFIGIND